ncbi:Pyrimidodiazepine synthase [Schistosoma japonicum]|nr:Pyrimidodiazepine synthase [Schistosoma japonicum]
MHLKRSDPKPPIDPNRLTLIGFRFCPYVDRVKLVLSYYKVDYDLINISLISKPDWFLEMYPTGKVPLLLLQNGQKLPESDIIMRYIDKIYGSEALLSHCGVGEFEKAKELVNQISRSTYMIISVPEINPCDISHYRQACSQINEAIKGPYFTGNSFIYKMFEVIVSKVCIFTTNHWYSSTYTLSVSSHVQIPLNVDNYEWKLKH